MEKIEKNRTNPRVLPYGERLTGGEYFLKVIFEDNTYQLYKIHKQ